MIYIGIDPGASGGIAVMRTGDRVLNESIETFKLKDSTERDAWQFLESNAMSDSEAFAYIERVSASPQMGVVSAFTFGRSYGFLRGMLTGALVPFEEVSPAKWQKAIGCLSKGDKNITKAKAQQLFPTLKITHGNADCLLIAEYCRRVRTGMLASV